MKKASSDLLSLGVFNLTKENTMTTKLTIENLSHKNVKSSIKNWSKEGKVKLAVFNAELVLHLHEGSSEAPRNAI